MTCLAFDIDGTIFDCTEIIVDAFRQGIIAFSKTSSKKIQLPGKQEIKSVLGTPHDQIFQQLFPDLENDDQYKINELSTESLVKIVNNGGGNIFKGVSYTLKLFHKQGYKIFAASNGNQQYIEAVLKSNDLFDYFSKPLIVLGPTIISKSEIVKYYKDNICNDDLLIMIGDRHTDMIAAKENDVPFIGCVFGHAESSELKGSQWLTADFNNIFNIVKEIEK